MLYTNVHQFDLIIIPTHISHTHFSHRLEIFSQSLFIDTYVGFPLLSKEMLFKASDFEWLEYIGTHSSNVTRIKRRGISVIVNNVYIYSEGGVKCVLSLDA